MNLDTVVNENTFVCGYCLVRRLRTIQDLKFLPYNVFYERTRDFRTSFSKRVEHFKIYRCEDCKIYMYLNSIEGLIKSHEFHYINAVADADIDYHFSIK